MRRRAAVLLSGALALATASCAQRGPHEIGAFESIALQGLWIEALLALIALVGAALLPGSAVRRLGLAPGRLDVARIALLVVGTLAASAALDGLLELTQWKAHSALADFESLLAGVRGRALLLALLAFALMPGIAEELLCRGLLQRTLVDRLGPAAGIAIASMVFGALHLDPVHALFAAPLGVYLGLVCWLSGGIRAAVVCHIANNLTALLAEALLPDAEPPALPTVLLGATVAAAAMAWVWHEVGPPTADRAPPPPPGAPLQTPENPL
jgi:membrane protease YdiL (CAAX protease family)